MTGLVPGILLIPALRGVIFLHSVPNGEPWRQNCPKCHMSIRLIALGSRCHHCQAKIGPLTASVELAALGTLALLAWRLTDAVALAAISWVAVLGIALIYIDIAVHRLPDRLTLLAFGGAVVFMGIGNPDRIWRALLCCLALASAYLVMSLTSGGAMGLGDSKFALSLGLALGWFGWFATFYGAALGFVFSGLFALVMLVSGRLTIKQSIPHGPFMLLGALAAILTATG